MVVVSLAGTAVADADLALFRDVPDVEVLDLSHTSVGDAGLDHLAGLEALEDLIVVDTRISKPALDAFQRDHPSVRIRTGPLPKGTINPFTGEPL